MIEKDFDISFIADLALHEKQIQQNYRPIIAVHKWFARRPGTLFRGLILSEFVGGNLKENYYKAHNLRGVKVADPFMGGGTPIVEANRLGCDIVGYDINPMSYWVVSQEIEPLNINNYRQAASELLDALRHMIGAFYKTRCVKCGSPEASVKYFIWVKTHRCSECEQIFDLFPSYILAENRRHPRNVIICSFCGDLNEVEDRKNPGKCCGCQQHLQTKGPANRNRCTCPHCGAVNLYPDPSPKIPGHRMVAMEYFCPDCKSAHKGRFFKKPDAADLINYEEARQALLSFKTCFIPSDEIPRGDETDRLHRWGYRLYRDMFNERQLLGLELSCQIISRHPDRQIRNALATNLSDLLRYQNMLCRYDTTALKSLDIFSVHGFPVSLIQCESNFLGILNGEKGLNVGSGGWLNIIEKYVRAKTYCEKPFEIRHQNGRKIQVPVEGEWIGVNKNDYKQAERKKADLYCASSTSDSIPLESLDGVFTDPPYFANVQYAELMDFCYVWLRKIALLNNGYFDKPSTRDENELTGNSSMERGIAHFTEGLSISFANMARALKPGAPFVFTYHHNKIEAYYPIAAAILDAGLACSATIPCPAEMSASIHINGTGSSIMDTVFVCRSTGVVKRYTISSEPEKIADMVIRDLEKLRKGNVRSTPGDIRCITYGHLIRLAVWNLRKEWDVNLSTHDKLNRIAGEIEKIGGWVTVENVLKTMVLTDVNDKPDAIVYESIDREEQYEISF